MISKPKRGKWIVILDKLTKCFRCNSYFTSAKIFNEHFKAHLDETKVKAEEKLEIANEFQNTKNEIIHNIKVKEYKCKQCEKSFESFKSLTIHELQDHGQVCEFCPRRFYEIGKSHNHTREFHTMYKCNQCQREFDTKNNFKEHNKLHLRPGYQCTICDIKLKSKQSATHHFSNVHNNI